MSCVPCCERAACVSPERAIITDDTTIRLVTDGCLGWQVIVNLGALRFPGLFSLSLFASATCNNHCVRRLHLAAYSSQTSTSTAAHHTGQQDLEREYTHKPIGPRHHPDPDVFIHTEWFTASNRVDQVFSLFFYSSFCYFFLFFFLIEWTIVVVTSSPWRFGFFEKSSSLLVPLMDVWKDTSGQRWRQLVFTCQQMYREREWEVRFELTLSVATKRHLRKRRKGILEKTNGRKRETKKIKKSVTPSALTNFTLFSSLLTLSSFLPVCLTWPLTLETHHLNKRLRPRPRTTERKKPKNKKLRIQMACVCPYTLYSRQQSGPISGYLKKFLFSFSSPHVYLDIYIYIFTLKTFFQESTTHRNIKSNILPCRVCL